jgi:hypothetical protein
MEAMFRSNPTPRLSLQYLSRFSLAIIDAQPDFWRKSKSPLIFCEICLHHDRGVVPLQATLSDPTKSCESNRKDEFLMKAACAHRGTKRGASIVDLYVSQPNIQIRSGILSMKNVMRRFAGDSGLLHCNDQGHYDVLSPLERLKVLTIRKDGI